MQRVWVAGVFLVFDGPTVCGGRHVHDDHTRYDDFDRSRDGVDDRYRFVP